MQSTAAKLALIAGAIAVVVVLFVVLQGGDDKSDTTTTATTNNGTTTTKPPEPAIPKIVLKNGKPVGGVKDLDFKSGEQIRFTVVPDIDGDIHIHGYDLEKPGTSGKKTSFNFKATIEGVFAVEDHGNEQEIARLKVSP